VETELEKERSRRAGKPRNTLLHRTVHLGGIELLPKLYTLAIADDSIDGRSVWKLEATPRTDVKAETEEERDALGTRRTYWIDMAENAVVRERAEFLIAQRGLQPGTVLALENAKINGDCWLQVRLTLAFEFTPVKFVRIRGETDYRFLNYKKFDVGSSIEFESAK
jgi:hypothetical protein